MSDILRNIRQQATNLASIAEYLQSAGETQLSRSAALMRSFRRIAFVGVGGSRNAAQPAAIYLSRFGIDTRVLDASELLYYEKAPLNTALILVSRSGRTAEMVLLAENLDRAGIPYIAVTNSADSPMAANAVVAGPVAGETDNGISIRTYTGAVLTLLYLSAAMVENLNILQAEIAAMLPKLESRMAEWEMEDLRLKDSTFFVS
jgi:glucosamine--fructose-6-phosphate aminotransferase (isomerizing)